MGIATILGLADHGRHVSEKEFETADFEPGYRYELIDGRLYVSSEPELPENTLEGWLYSHLTHYVRTHPELAGYVSNKARVDVPGRRTTIPEPDIAYYRPFPHQTPIQNRRWRDVSPMIVAEVLVEGDAYKDLVRNVALFLEVPTIREYWILDGRESADQPTLIVRRRRGQSWLRPRKIGWGEAFVTPNLPGFRLRIDPRR